MGRKQNLMLVGQAPYLILTLVILYVMHTVIKKYLARESDLELLKLNYGRLVDDIGPYISYYKPKTHVENSPMWRKWLSGKIRPHSAAFGSLKRLGHRSAKRSTQRQRQRTSSTGTRGARGGGGTQKHPHTLRKPPASGRHTLSTRHSAKSEQSEKAAPPMAAFPNVCSVVESASYNERQTALLMRYTIGKMSFKDYTQLTVLRHEEQGNVTSFDQTSPESFRMYGRMIGNSCVFRTPKGESSYSYFANIEYDTHRHCYSLRKNHTFESVSPKFRALCRQFIERPLRRLVYSNFNEASATLSAYLTKKGVPHKYLRDPATDSRHKPMEYDHVMKWIQQHPGGVLLIGQSYSEGLSVTNIDEMHILDPCESVAKNDQTRGRVARLGSHPPGATVRIVQWLTNMGGLTKLLSSVKEWFAHSPYVWYTDLITNHKQSITPDAVVYREVNRLAKSTDKVIQLLQQRSIERYVKEGIPKRCKSQEQSIRQICV
jgi:hypothetical protein